MVFKVTITIEWNGWGQPLGSMVFRWFWGKTTIGNDGFRWLCTIGLTMEWLCTIVEVYSWTFFCWSFKKRNTTWDLLSVWRTLTALVMALHRRIVAIIRSWPHPPRSTAWLAGGDLANFGSRLTFVPLPRSTSPPKTFTNTRSEQLFCLPCLYLMTSTKQHKASFDFFDKRVCRSITDSINLV